MKEFKFRTFYSSFWLLFIASLIINQLVVLSIVYLTVMRPLVNNTAQIFGIAMKATNLIYKQDRAQGSIELQNLTPQFSDIKIGPSTESFEEIPKYYFALRVFKNSLEQKLGGKFRIGLNREHQILILQSIEYPEVSINMRYKGTFLGLRVVGLASLLALIIGTVAAFWISKRLVRPLEHLSDAASRLGKTKDFKKIEIRSGTSKEIVQLTNTLNEMQVTLDDSIKERERLLAGVTHDVRTPLSRMRLAIELEGHRNPEFASGLLEDVIEMSAILDQFNELSRLNTEHDESWVIGDVYELILGIQAKYQRSGMGFKFETESMLPLIKHKPIALTRLLYNLINNAYRHGNGDVKIQMRKFNNQVKLTIINPLATSDDEGTGLIMALRNKDSGHTAGLGLSIVKRFAEVHGAIFQEQTVSGIRKYSLYFEAQL